MSTRCDPKSDSFERQVLGTILLASHEFVVPRRGDLEIAEDANNGRRREEQMDLFRDIDADYESAPSHPHHEDPLQCIPRC